MNLAWYTKILGEARALAVAAGWVALSACSAWADVAASGSFVATKDCPAFQSFRKGTNPGGVKIETGRSYPLLEKNASNATHYRIRIDGASPPERWVSVDCGSYSDEGANDGGLQNSPAGDRLAAGHRAEAILSLSWEPAFCEGHANKRECASATPSGFDATHFTLHGLWPQPRTKQYCNVSLSFDRRR